MCRTEKVDTSCRVTATEGLYQSSGVLAGPCLLVSLAIVRSWNPDEQIWGVYTRVECETRVGRGQRSPKVEGDGPVSVLYCGNDRRQGENTGK